MDIFFRLKYFLKYQYRSKTKYYLHSPFVYQFYLHVLTGETDAQLKAIEALRKTLHNNNTSVLISDFGTGNSSHKKISDIESTVAVRPKYGLLLYRLVKYFKPNYILEIGTSIGLSSAYLALAYSEAKITTLEGSPKLAELAHKNYAALGITNVAIIEGNFNDTLPAFINQQDKLDLVFFDGNHTKAATLQYFNLCLAKAHAGSIFVFDDIHWSEHMHSAWTEIKAHPQITLALDIFQFGICFFTKEKLAKEEFMLRY